MSQILLPQKYEKGISQDIILLEKKHYLPSSANLISCVVCNMGLDDGYSLTAKKTHSGTLFYCENHFDI